MSRSKQLPDKTTGETNDQEEDTFFCVGPHEHFFYNIVALLDTFTTWLKVLVCKRSSHISALFKLGLFHKYNLPAL